MLKKLILENWKSFRYAELPLDPLTILIGANASGKSNAIEALSLLHSLAAGMSLSQALDGDESAEGVRGGIEWAQRQSSSSFRLKTILSSDKPDCDYLHCLEVATLPQGHVRSESLCFKSSNLSEEKENIFKARFLEHAEKQNGIEQFFPGPGVTVSFVEKGVSRATISIESDISALVPMSGL